MKLRSWSDRFYKTAPMNSKAPETSTLQQPKIVGSAQHHGFHPAFLTIDILAHQRQPKTGSKFSKLSFSYSIFFSIPIPKFWSTKKSQNSGRVKPLDVLEAVFSVGFWGIIPSIYRMVLTSRSCGSPAWGEFPVAPDKNMGSFMIRDFFFQRFWGEMTGWIIPKWCVCMRHEIRNLKSKSLESTLCSKWSMAWKSFCTNHWRPEKRTAGRSQPNHRT